MTERPPSHAEAMVLGAGVMAHLAQCRRSTLWRYDTETLSLHADIEWQPTFRIGAAPRPTAVIQIAYQRVRPMQ